MGPPPPAVVAAFRGDVRDVEHQLGGITGSVWRAGSVALKPHDGDEAKAIWCAAALDATLEDGFRVARPVRANTGGWVVGGWTAHRWVPGVHRTDRWLELIDAVRAFHAALPAAIQAAGLDPHPAWQNRADHIYARAERAVFFGGPVSSEVLQLPGTAEQYHRAVAAGPPLTAEHAERSQLIHGDPASNALWDDDASPPYLIDMSPSWRPADTLDAQILVEAVLWFEQPVELLDAVAGTADGRAHIARACAYRLYTRALVSHLSDEQRARGTARYAAILDHIGA